MPLTPKLAPVFYEQLTTPFGTSVFFAGPPLSVGPLPALFYFCATAQESLGTDPYNQPVVFLNNEPIRIFSMTLPGHTLGLDNRNAVSHWREEFLKQHNPLEAFLNEATAIIQHLVTQKVATSIGVAGLSRGAFIATHIAARSSHVGAILGFAPLTDLFCLEEFAPMRDNPLVTATTLREVAGLIVGKPLRFYMGNHDQRISTDACYHFIRHLTQLSFQKGKRSPQVELILSPSIGHLGHGTAPKTFSAGAQWIANTLKEKQGS